MLWGRRHGLAQADTYEELDNQLSEYLEWLWDSGFSKHDAGDTICGIQHFLRVKRRFPAAWALFKAWTLLEAPVRARQYP